MAGGKETPRQKMIGMMYLVLTALLALNVSKDILNAFVIVNEGIQVTTENFEKKNKVTYDAFAKAKADDQKRVEPLYNKATQIKAKADELFKYIDGLKGEITAVLEDIPKNQADTLKLRYVNNKDNQDIPSNIMIGVNEKKGKARELKEMINKFKELIHNSVKDIRGGDRVRIGLETADPSRSTEHGRETWESENFEHIPAAAVITLLSKMQSDVRNAEANAVDFLFSQIGASTFKFDSLTAKVIAPSSFILKGNKYTAEILLTAYSTTQDPDILVGGSPIKVENGIGLYETTASKEGPNKWGGVINFKGPDGNVISRKFESEFTCAPPFVTVSATKMNVIYKGIPNPFSISVPSVPPDKIRVSISSGSISRKSGSEYEINVPSNVGAPKVTITVDAEVSGKMQRMGQVDYRLKSIPAPITMVAGLSRGGIARGDLLAQGGIIPSLGEDFLFELYYTVINYEMKIFRKGKDPFVARSTSNRITDEMKDEIRNARVGDVIIFSGIRVKGPDGVTKDSKNDVVLTLR